MGKQKQVLILAIAQAESLEVHGLGPPLPRSRDVELDRAAQHPEGRGAIGLAAAELRREGVQHLVDGLLVDGPELAAENDVVGLTPHRRGLGLRLLRRWVAAASKKDQREPPSARSTFLLCMAGHDAFRPAP